MVAKYWLATGKALRPGYFRVNILDMHPDGQMFVTEDQVPNDVSLETLIHHLDMLRPANSKHNDHVLCNAYESIDETVEMSKDHDQRPRSNFRRRRRRDAIKLRKSAQARYFKLVAPNSERGTWHHILHVSQGGSQTYKIPEGSRSLAPHLWKPLDGTAALVKIKKASQQGKLPVFVRVSSFYRHIDASK